MLKPEVVLAVVGKVVKKNKLLGDLLSTGQVAQLASQGLLRPVDAGEVLCRQGQDDKTLYLIIDGQMQASVAGDNGSRTLALLGAGDIIGELAGLFMMPRIATVSATRPGLVLEIPAEIFSALLDSHSALRTAVINRCKNRVIETALRCVPLFADLDNAAFHELSYLSLLVAVEPGTVIAHEGQIERHMYVVCHGAARVHIAVDGREVTTALLRPGEYFGEYSLFTGQRRAASVSALTAMQLVTLEGEAFQSFLDENEGTGMQLNRAGLQRKLNLDQARDELSLAQAAQGRLRQVEDWLINLDGDVARGVGG